MICLWGLVLGLGLGLMTVATNAKSMEGVE